MRVCASILRPLANANFPICPSCNGIGFIDFGDTLPCSTCMGTGYVDIKQLIQDRVDRDKMVIPRYSSATHIAVRKKDPNEKG